ncbi:hypothetical protein [Effusibacillus lacus]|uniref:Lipoprotein n=1 Tax=Effusibacillus lacus TaxID=1348429 RepID=A0A292YKM9_9BACL|nr:hypothetical protein [Effusibacillus lacus]TCS74999.1 hypothetical protein EDD64_110123 [Effusibacillus lacus]GAX91667.1 hypothetical protein EFBL_3357 [Effusibacillus lacus]
MKKGISLLLVTILTAGLLTACSSNNDQKMNDKNMPGMDHSKMQNDKK